MSTNPALNIALRRAAAQKKTATPIATTAAQVATREPGQPDVSISSNTGDSGHKASTLDEVTTIPATIRVAPSVPIAGNAQPADSPTIDAQTESSQAPGGAMLGDCPPVAGATVGPSEDTAYLEQLLRNTWERWRGDPDRGRDAWHARQYANVAIRLGLPCYGEDGQNLGVRGWCKWWHDNYAIKTSAPSMMPRQLTIDGALLERDKGEQSKDNNNINASALSTASSKTTLVQNLRNKVNPMENIEIEQTTVTPIDAGPYPARIINIESVKGGQYGDQVKFTFEVLSPEEAKGRTLVGWASAKFSDKSKLYLWTRAALDADIPPDYKFRSGLLIGKTVKVVVAVMTRDDGSEYNKILEVKPLRKAAAAKPTTQAKSVAPVLEMPEEDDVVSEQEQLPF